MPCLTAPWYRRHLPCVSRGEEKHAKNGIGLLRPDSDVRTSSTLCVRGGRYDTNEHSLLECDGGVNTFILTGQEFSHGKAVEYFS
jgi:hypothetical protein